MEKTKAKMPEEWQSCDDVIKSNEFMLENQYACDVMFMLGNEGVRHGAHKYVLISRSPVFDAMFCGPLSADKGKDTVVEIPDIEPEPFLSFMRYLYCGETEITPENVIYLLYSSKKYAVPGLASRCLTYVGQVMNTDNACTVLEQAHIFNEKEFYDTVMALILRKAEEVLVAEDVTYLCDECLAAIVSSDKLMAPEILIFEACMRWANSECQRRCLEVNDSNRRLVLSKTLYQIRFPLLPVEEFMDKVVPNSLLSGKEKVDIMGRFIVPNRPSTYFNIAQRIAQRQLRLNRFQGIFGTGFNNRSGSNAISFQASEDIILEGFTIYGSCKASGQELEVKGEVFDSAELVLCSVEKIIFTRGDKGAYDVIFDEPTPIKRLTHCTLVVSIAGAPTFAGKDGRHTAFSHNVAFTFTHSDKSHTGTTVSHGQLPGLIFSLEP